jgi:hypothetical protein
MGFLSKTSVLGLLCMLLLTAARQLPGVKAEWVVIADPSAPKTISFKRGDYVKFARMRPKGLFLAEADALDDRKKVIIAKGAYLMTTEGRGLVCETVRKSITASFACLTDKDGDGRFEGWQKVQLPSEFFLGAVGFDKAGALATPASLKILDAAKDGPEFFVELVYVRRGGETSKNAVHICIRRHGFKNIWGGEIPAEMCRRDEIEFGNDAYPFVKPLYGGKIVFLSATDGVIETRFEPPPADIKL